MNGKPYDASKFAFELRKQCFKSLFGFKKDEEVEDPLSSEMWVEIDKRTTVRVKLTLEEHRDLQTVVRLLS